MHAHHHHTTTTSGRGINGHISRASASTSHQLAAGSIGETPEMCTAKASALGRLVVSLFPIRSDPLGRAAPIQFREGWHGTVAAGRLASTVWVWWPEGGRLLVLLSSGSMPANCNASWGL
ncbi:hypothetical protein SORBI_3007G191150 [Sorghum bicolor]|uniref:Uncharacterized protein n=1 Tax=Sorghum bicolor TaxID=4558 RepID=A0A1Z5RAP1_SORBI|nr:hypothetical protein SORBI_3007G191150 [Sorghum bicolor]